MLEYLAQELERGDHTNWSGLAYRHTAPSFDPLSTRGAELHGGRWNVPGMPALYLATSPEIARAEFDRLVRLRAQSAASLLPRNLATIRLDLESVTEIDGERLLRELGMREAGKYEDLSLTACRTAGAMVARSGNSGLLAPSVAGHGPVVVAFPENFGIEDSLELVEIGEVDWA